ncbi:hypothetical protein WMY93_013461 [Mugilogobius chulae]|uniref:MARVEL domain-containing protein n=1 Tax=Mugilogobius chulae TaxID=88201 RepID=A0AAW0NZJ8_9GOBI
MSEDHSKTPQLEVDFAFLKSYKGILKLAELTTLFAAFVSFCVASASKYITATAIEFTIVLTLILLYAFKLNKKIQLIFWPLVDSFNSLFGSLFILVLSIIAMSLETSERQLFGTMGDIEAPGSNDAPSNLAVLRAFLPSKEFSTSKKGMLLIGEVVSSFIAFVCFAASWAAAFVTVPLIEFLGALFILFAYSAKFNERFKGFLWPLMDFLRCVSAAIIYFIVSIIAVSNYRDGSSKGAGIFGFIATIIFALDFYIIFIELAEFLKQGGESQEEPTQQEKYSDSDEDSD